MTTLPHVAKESCFALKGGTAINLFVQDFPRLSVDIDLVYKAFADRDTDLEAINDALTRITESLNGRPGITAIRQENKADEKRIIVNTIDAQIKIEVSPVWRGLLLPPAEMPVCEQVEMEYGFTTMNVVSLADLYGETAEPALSLFSGKMAAQNEGPVNRASRSWASCRPPHRSSLGMITEPPEWLFWPCWYEVHRSRVPRATQP